MFQSASATVRVSCLAGQLGDVEAGEWWPRLGMADPAHAVTVTPEAALRAAKHKAGAEKRSIRDFKQQQAAEKQARETRAVHGVDG